MSCTMKNRAVRSMGLLKDFDVGNVHLLGDSWKLWYWRSDGLAVSVVGPVSRQNWLDNLHGLCEFDSVEKFWRQVPPLVDYECYNVDCA